MEIGKIDNRRTFLTHPEIGNRILDIVKEHPEIGNRILDIVKEHPEIGKRILDMVKEHPDYPIAVLVWEEANVGDYYWMYATSVKVEVGEILDCVSEWVNDEIVTADRDRFEEEVEDKVWDRLKEELGRKPTDEEQDEAVKAVLKAHEPCWVKCITITADNWE